MSAWHQFSKSAGRAGLHDRHPRRAPASKSITTRYTRSTRGTHRSISSQEHDTPSFKAWHKVLEGFGDDLLSAYPPECKVVDEFFIKSRSTETGKDAVLAGLVFETSGLKAVKKFFDNGKSPIFQQGRKDGWLTGKWRENYFASAAASESRHPLILTRRCSDFRGPTPGPPPQFQKGWGISARAASVRRRRRRRRDAAQASARTASASRTRTGSRPSARPRSTPCTSR